MSLLRADLHSPNIEAGKKYLDRKGRTIGPLRPDFDEWCPWYFTDSHWNGRAGWRKNGQFSDRSKPQFDLMSETQP